MNTSRLLIICSLVLLAGPGFPQDLEKVKDIKPFTLHGNAGLSLMAYSMNGIPSRQQPFSYVFSANANATIYGIELPFNFTYSDRQARYSQPFGQFGLKGSYNGISPKYKWIKLHAGYRSVNFSEYTLAGHTFLGGGIELNPGILRLGFVYGRFDRNTYSNPVFGADTLPRFKRKGFAAKIGIGTADNFFDLIFLKILDDSTSIQQPSTGPARLAEQNIIGGFNSRFTIKKNLTLETEAAASLYTDNLSARPVLDNTAPAILLNVNKFLMFNFSSHYYTAIRSALQYKAKLWALRLEYKRIDPNYRSMGSYYVNSDIETLMLRPSLKLFKRKVTINGSLGLQQDNLQDTKRATSMRTIGNLGLSINPSAKFGIDANYGNLSFNQNAGRMPLNDTIKMMQTTQNLTLTPRLTFAGDKNTHMIMLLYNMAAMNDKNSFATDLNNFRSQTGQLDYMLSLADTKWSFNIGLTFTSFIAGTSATRSAGGLFGISKSLLEDKLSLNWNHSILRSDDDYGKGWIYNMNLSGNYRIQKNHTARLSVYYTGNYTEPGSLNRSFNEIKGEISYVYAF